MLNTSLYRTSWLIAGVAIVVALLTLQPPLERSGRQLEATPPAADGAQIAAVAQQLREVAPQRPPGTQAAEEASVRWVQERFRQLPLARQPERVASRVRTQTFTARVEGQLTEMVNVYAVLPGSTEGLDRGGVVVVAPRDTSPGESSPGTDTALLIETARLAATTPQRRRPMLFVSVSGSTVGNAGARWFLHRFRDFPISAVVVIDDLGTAKGPVWIWKGARAPVQAIGLAEAARVAAVDTGAGTAPPVGTITQLMRYAVPQTFGDQAPFVKQGIPAVALSSRPEGPARPIDPVDADRMAQAGNIVFTLVSRLDQGLPIPEPDSSLVVAGRVLRSEVVRIVLFLFALPLWVAAVDAFARLRRARVKLRPGIRAVLWRGAPLAAAALTMHVLALAGAIQASAAGVPPLPRDVPFGASQAMVLAVSLLVGVLVWLMSHHLRRGEVAPPASEAAAGLVVLGAVSMVAWVVSPFVLVLTLPAAHATLTATATPRLWHASVLAVVGLMPLAILTASLGNQMGRDPFQAAWYLVATTAAGTRGLVAPTFALILASAILSMAIMVILRARKGLARRDDAPPRPERSGLATRALGGVPRERG